MDQLVANLPSIVIMYLCLLFSLCVHEAAHAVTAVQRGDPTPRFMGRLTLNPMAHIDPIGTVLLPLLMLALGPGYLFGWAKPVPFNPRNLVDIRKDPVMIAVAGPASNLLLSLLFVFLARVIGVTVGFDAFPELLVGFFGYMIIINLVLMVFNLIPVPPLDGHYVLHYFLPEGGQRFLEQIGPFGIIIVVLFVARPVFAFFSPVFVFFQQLAGI